MHLVYYCVPVCGIVQLQSAQADVGEFRLFSNVVSNSVLSSLSSLAYYVMLHYNEIINSGIMCRNAV